MRNSLLSLSMSKSMTAKRVSEVDALYFLILCVDTSTPTRWQLPVAVWNVVYRMLCLSGYYVFRRICKTKILFRGATAFAKLLCCPARLWAGGILVFMPGFFYSISCVYSSGSKLWVVSLKDPCHELYRSRAAFQSLHVSGLSFEICQPILFLLFTINAYFQNTRNNLFLF